MQAGSWVSSWRCTLDYYGSGQLEMESWFGFDTGNLYGVILYGKEFPVQERVKAGISLRI